MQLRAYFLAKASKSGHFLAPFLAIIDAKGPWMGGWARSGRRGQKWVRKWSFSGQKSHFLVISAKISLKQASFLTGFAEID